mmetsp:Transcript_28532/g.98519  ORF Transcript_28532/g.98519 Transcript_28532/m.98519 type:complete len:89 (+) Transcript_28532:4433-4699(+)
MCRRSGSCGGRCTIWAPLRTLRGKEVVGRDEETPSRQHVVDQVYDEGGGRNSGKVVLSVDTPHSTQFSANVRFLLHHSSQGLDEAEAR